MWTQILYYSNEIVVNNHHFRIHKYAVKILARSRFNDEDNNQYRHKSAGAHDNKP